MDSSTAMPHFRHPDPASPSSSADNIAVATSDDAALVQSIEQGEYGTDTEVDSDSHSLTPSVRKHVVDGHLRYHAYHAGQYAFPNDETEQYRDNLKHALTIHLCDGNYFYAPLHRMFEQGAEVLDLGTGTGKWCIEMADFFPNSHFHGMDLSPIQPDWVPENVEFFVDDIEHEGGWTYPENNFDYIHVRHTSHSIKNRRQMWQRIYDHLKPGGYVEVQEFQYVAACDDNSCDKPYAWRDFLTYLEAGLAAMGSELNGVRFAEDELLAAGFRDLRYQDLKCPVGPWPKKLRLQECGHMLRDVIMWGLVGLARRPFRDGLGWTNVQIEMFLVNVRKDLSREKGNGLPEFHTYFPFRSIFGRKPLDAR